MQGGFLVVGGLGKVEPQIPGQVELLIGQIPQVEIAEEDAAVRGRVP